MAKIISSRKKYVPVKDLKVYPSNKETIEVLPDDGFNGAHRYRAYVPSVSLGWPDILELAETEEELLDYLKDVSEFTRDEKGNN